MEEEAPVNLFELVSSDWFKLGPGFVLSLTPGDRPGLVLSLSDVWPRGVPVLIFPESPPAQGLALSLPAWSPARLFTLPTDGFEDDPDLSPLAG